MNDSRMTITRSQLHREHLRTAYNVAQLSSTDPNTKTGAVITLGDVELVYGSNRVLHESLNAPEFLKKPEKYAFVEHAERDAITKSARDGIKLAGSTIYTPFLPCSSCSNAIVGAGIETVVAHERYMEQYGGPDWFNWADENVAKWGDSINKGLEILTRSGVEVLLYRGSIGECESFVRDRSWKP